MSYSHFMHLLLGLFVGLLPTIFRLIIRKLDGLGPDPVAQAIMEEAIRKQNAKFSSLEKPDNSKADDGKDPL